MTQSELEETPSLILVGYTVCHCELATLELPHPSCLLNVLYVGSLTGAM